ncbi:LysR family transcriptional regulator [Pseudonocardia sp. Ae505_Ps2]|uniref:LysR family transcriptional regulator n=1 Tax=Pseudonocardia sp. Ae505_Ps2 TaxID=1885034 RepID=UPI0014834B1E|nr:LysR family transcriptional regulator [Pseudonocardia sp. Ae505_Ps2]
MEQARCVLAILRTGSFRDAARDLGMSQSTLSEAVRALERELGVQLLHRRRRGVSATEVGAAVRPQLEHIARAAAEVQNTVAAFSEAERGRLRVGVVTAAAGTVLPAAIGDLLAGRPDLELQVSSTGSSEIGDAVAAGRLDAGLITVLAGAPAPPGLTVVPLLRCPLVVCAPLGHRFADLAEVPAAELATERLIAYRPGYLMHDLLGRLVELQTATVVYRTDDTRTALAMIAAHVGVTVLPELSVPDPQGLLRRPLAQPHPEVLVALVHAHDDKDPAVAAFGEILLRHARASAHDGTSGSTSVRSSV